MATLKLTFEFIEKSKGKFDLPKILNILFDSFEVLDETSKEVLFEVYQGNLLPKDDTLVDLYIQESPVDRKFRFLISGVSYHEETSKRIIHNYEVLLDLNDPRLV